MRYLRLTLLVVILCVTLNGWSQNDTLTLGNCIKIGIENNLLIKSSQQDLRISEIAESENRSKLLPVIYASACFTDNLHKGTSVADGTNLSKALGIDIPYLKSRGLEYATTGNFKFSMPLYDQTIYTSINIADRMIEISRCSYDLAIDNLIMEIAQLYYLIQTTQEQIVLTESNIERLEGLNNITTALYDNDMALQLDVQRVAINLENLRVQLDNSKSLCEQQKNLLRYALNMEPDYPIIVTRISSDNIISEAKLLIGVSTGLKELRLMKMQSELLQKKKQSVKQSYLPTLSLVGEAAWTAYTDRFRNYFHNHPTNSWYNSTFWGLKLSIPVFDGLSRKHKISTLDAQYIQNQILIEDTERNLQTRYNNAVNDLHNNMRNLRRSSENYHLAENVYSVTAEQYREGVSSMSTLLQDELSMTDAQKNYITTLYNFLLSELKLLKLTDQLESLVD